MYRDIIFYHFFLTREMFIRITSHIISYYIENRYYKILFSILLDIIPNGHDILRLYI